MRRVVGVLGVLGLLVLVGSGVAGARQALQISLDPPHGEPGTNVTVTGSGFDSCPDHGSGDVVRVLWDGHTMIGETVREADGTIVEWVAVPADATPGEHTIYAQCYDGGEYATALFTVPSGEDGGGPVTGVRSWCRPRRCRRSSSGRTAGPALRRPRGPVPRSVPGRPRPGSPPPWRR